jgi:hypothetical protein
MSRAIAGRSVLATRARPRFVNPVIPRAMVGTPCNCFCTGDAVTGTAHGSGTTTAPFTGGSISDVTDVNACDTGDFELRRGIMCATDMTATITVDNWWNSNPAGFDESTSVVLSVRVDHGRSLSLGYDWFMGAAASGGHYIDRVGFTGLTVSDGSGTTGLDGNDPCVLTDGDELELSAIGTAIVAKQNGVTIFSVTDATIGETITYGSDDLPASYASWRAVAAASTITVSGYTVVPICP